MRTSSWLTLALCLAVPGSAPAAENAPAVPRASEQHATHGDEAAAPHWGYSHEDGPGRWNRLSPDWQVCGSGREQSPVDIRDAVVSSDFCRVELDMPTANLRVIRQRHVFDALDNGHTIQVNVDAGDTLTIGSTTYSLLQFHFHAPSEHTVGGMHYPMEMHLVHTNEDGDIAVVGVFIREGAHNSAFDQLWRNLPDEIGEETHLEDVATDVDEILPPDLTGWRYHGSLTTPPCTEKVRWIVLKMPIEFDRDQIDQFRNLFHGNTRPVQRLNGRTIITDCPDVK